MDSDDVYKFIGYTVVVMFFLYIISKTMRLNARIIEGMAGAIGRKKDTQNSTTTTE